MVHIIELTVESPGDILNGEQPQFTYFILASCDDEDEVLKQVSGDFDLVRLINYGDEPKSRKSFSSEAVMKAYSGTIQNALTNNGVSFKVFVEGVNDA